MTTNLAPEPTQIRLHLEVLFSELMPGGAFEDGLFELRFLHPEGRKPFCRLFKGYELDAAIELAISKNSAGWNAFAGPNPRQPGTTGAGRAENVARSNWQFVDCDDGESSARLRDLPFPPNFIVATGSEPTERLHGYFMLESPELNMDAFTARQTALAECVGGDNVKDPPRVMRLAGTVSYPSPDKLKRGYVEELVTISNIDPHAWSSEDLDRLSSGCLAKSVKPVNHPLSQTACATPPSATIRSLLCQSQQSGHWHNSMRSVTSRLLIRGYSEAQVMEICGPYCDDGTGDPDLAVLISSAVKKGFSNQLADPASQILLKTPRDRGNLLSRKNIIKLGDARYVTEQSYLIKNWLPYEGTGVLFGPSNTGKTFLALGMAACVAGGIEWHGHKVRQGAVLYLATEGNYSFNNRMTAVREDLDLSDETPLIARADMVNLLDPEADLREIMALADEIKAQHGPIRMIVVDTLARAMAGGDENGPSDMSKLIGNVDALRQGTEAFVLLIHHTGKDETRGARGHSSLKGAVDQMLVLSSNNEVIQLASEKERDMEKPRPKAFRLETITCGEDEDGDPVTTCVVREEDLEHFKQTKQPKGANQVQLMECYTQLRLEGIGEPNPDGVGFPEPGQYWCIPSRTLREHFNGRYSGSNASSAYHSAFNGLRKKGVLCMNNELVWVSTDVGKC